MKNLMIYVNQSKDFVNRGFNIGWEDEAGVLVKVQIDNSLALGWDRKDIMLVTNFDYEYNGVRARVVGDETCCPHSPTASKINVIIDLFERGIIGDDLYWFHDLDAFQLVPLTEGELGLGHDEIGVTDYGRSSINPGRDLRWSTGTIFFRKGSLDFFRMWQTEIYKYRTNEEIALLEMLKKGRYTRVRHRVRKVNITYNLATRKRKVAEAYEMADKPLRVIHFHPFDRRPVEGENDNMAVCVHGLNWMSRPLVTRRLVRVFKSHGIE